MYLLNNVEYKPGEACVRQSIINSKDFKLLLHVELLGEYHLSLMNLLLKEIIYELLNIRNMAFIM
jgi:hypothetical protein